MYKAGATFTTRRKWARPEQHNTTTVGRTQYYSKQGKKDKKCFFVFKNGKFIHCSPDSECRCVKGVSAREIRSEESFFFSLHLLILPTVPCCCCCCCCFRWLHISCSGGGGIMLRLMVIELWYSRVSRQRFHLGSCSVETAFHNYIHWPGSVCGCK